MNGIYIYIYKSVRILIGLKIHSGSLDIYVHEYFQLFKKKKKCNSYSIKQLIYTVVKLIISTDTLSRDVIHEKSVSFLEFFC